MKFIVIIAVFVVCGIYAESRFDGAHPYDSRIAYLSNITSNPLAKDLFDDIISLMRAFREELPALRSTNPPIPPKRYNMVDKLAGFAIKGAMLAKKFPEKQFRDMKIKPTIFVPIVQIIARLKPKGEVLRLFTLPIQLSQ